MSRSKSRHSIEVCGDCGAADATWASVNKGIILCTQCCSVHRSLGRHISIVKSLQKSKWHPNQLAMVSTLNNNGANNIWEHTLLESASKHMKKKPNPKDSIQVKTEFIKAKHYQCAYAFRENFEDGLLSVENELGKQLHASVRTANLETSFRLLVLGADPNYFHDEKGSTPLHVAVKSDQKLQVELLLVYGADPTCPDAMSKTPIDYAKQNVNKEVYHRLLENQYELTDTFVCYLTHRKPDHQSGVHFHVPPPAGFESNSACSAKLQKMPNHVFEELAVDVYDEIERRDTEATEKVWTCAPLTTSNQTECLLGFPKNLRSKLPQPECHRKLEKANFPENIWLSCVDAIDLNVVPFLPVDPTLSTTRNQGRQKLARFTTPELKNLVYDILLDIERRQRIGKRGQSLGQLRDFSQVSDDDPLYDSVASDDDYAVLPPIQEHAPASPTTTTTTNNKTSTNGSCERIPSDGSCSSSSSTSPNEKNVQEANSKSDDGNLVEQLTKRLQESDSTVTDLKAEVNKLKSCLEMLKVENDELKQRLLSQSGPQQQSDKGSVDSSDTTNDGDKDIESLQSVFLNNTADSNLSVTNGGDVELDFKQSRKNVRPSSMYETREGIKIPNWHLIKNQLKQTEPQQQQRNVTQSLYNAASTPQDRQTVLDCTELITRSIQHLCKSIQDRDNEDCVSSGEKVKFAVARLATILPKEIEGETIRLMVEILPRLLTECSLLQAAHNAKQDQKPMIIEGHLSKIRHYAFHLAKYTKEIVTKYSSGQ